MMVSALLLVAVVAGDIKPDWEDTSEFPAVRSVKDLEVLVERPIGLKVVVGDPKIIRATFDRFPELRKLHLEVNSNKVTTEQYQTLREFKKLELLVLSGDARVAVEHFGEIGKCNRLLGLKLKLP